MFAENIEEEDRMRRRGRKSGQIDDALIPSVRICVRDVGRR